MHRITWPLIILILFWLPLSPANADDAVANSIAQVEKMSMKDPVSALAQIEKIETSVRTKAPHRYPYLLSLKTNALLNLSKYAEAQAIIDAVLQQYDLNSNDRARFLWHKGELKFLLGDDKQGYNYLNQAAEAAVYTDDNELLALVLSSRSFAAVELNDLKQAKDDADFLVQLINQIQDPIAIAEIYYSIAHTYEGYKDYDKAEAYFQKTLEAYQRLNNEQQISTSYYYLGRVNTFAERPEKALNYYQRSLASAQRSGDLIGEAFAYWGMAKSMAQLDDHVTALSYLKAANIILADSSNIDLKLEVLLTWAQSARALQRFEEANEALAAAYAITERYQEEVEEKKLKLDYEQAQLNYALNNFEEAYQQLFDFTENNADFHKRKRDLAIAVARERQQTDLKEKEHQVLNQEKLAQQKALEYEMEQKRILVILAFVLALGLIIFTVVLQRNHMMKRSLEQLSITDELTQIANRRHVMQKLQTELDRGMRYQHPLSICIFDIDYFKKLNDSLGHVVGDEVLKKVAKVAKELIREQDMVGRIGGEEFLIVFPHASLEAAYGVCERLRKAVAVANYPGVHDAMPTISMGVAEANSDDTIESLLQRADNVLYKAKNAGRNQVIKCNQQSTV